MMCKSPTVDRSLKLALTVNSICITSAAGLQLSASAFALWLNKQTDLSSIILQNWKDKFTIGQNFFLH